MRKYFILFLVIVCLCCNTACTLPLKQSEEWNVQGIWISYYELQFGDKTEQQATTYLEDMFGRIANAGYNAVFCHVRANADALYPSAYFPWSVYALDGNGQPPSYDPLALMVTLAHKNGLQIHAWVNPYRISNQSADVSALASTHIARQWLEDGEPSNDHFVRAWGNGLYFDPSVPEVQRLILNGVQEIVENYAVDGVHIDDYFYPTTDPSFDASSYKAYKEQAAQPLPLEDWRRANVNTLVAGLYRVVHRQEGMLFGVSPAAHISLNKTDRNYTEYYADVAHWVQNKGYADYIAPQLYFGYKYPQEDYQFENLLNKWVALPRQNGVKLFIGLAGYKIGDSEQIGAEEWLNEEDILARQAQDVYGAGCNGVVVFSYGTLTSAKPLQKAQIQNLSNFLHKIKDD